MKSQLRLFARLRFNSYDAAPRLIALIGAHKDELASIFGATFDRRDIVETRRNLSFDLLRSRQFGSIILEHLAQRFDAQVFLADAPTFANWAAVIVRSRHPLRCRITEVGAAKDHIVIDDRLPVL